MQAGHYPLQSFPPNLDAVPPDGRAVETFAFVPGALAIGGVLGLTGSLIGIASHGFKEMEQLYLPAGCFAGAVLFGFWEIWRRTHRTAVAFWGSQIGVYRSGALTDTGYRTQIVIYQLSIVNTLRELMAFGFLGLFAGLGGMATLARDLGMGLTFLGAAAGLIGAFISSLYARIGCRHFFVPKGNGTEQVMFTRSAIDRFGV